MYVCPILVFIVSSIYHLFMDKGQVFNMPQDALGKVNQYYVLINGLILTGGMSVIMMPYCVYVRCYNVTKWPGIFH